MTVTGPYLYVAPNLGEIAGVNGESLAATTDRHRVSLSILAPSMGEIEYQTVCGKFLPIVTRYQTKSKERLILAVRVQPCRGE